MKRASDRIRDAISRATDGEIPKLIDDISFDTKGKLDIIARLSYLAGMSRALEIIIQYEREGVNDAVRD